MPSTNGAMLALDKKAYVLGGYSSRGSHRQTAEYDLASKQWSQGPPLPSARSESTAAVVGGTAILFGGWDDQNVLAATLVAKTAALAEGKPQAWEPLAVARAALESSAGSPTSDGRSNAASVLEPPPRRMHCMTAYVPAASAAVDGASAAGGCVYMFGGFADTRLNDLWRFDVATLTWSVVDGHGFVPSPRDSSVLVADVDNGQLILFGGYSSCRSNEVFTFNIESATWARQPTVTPPSARFGTFAALCGGSLFVGLGQDARGATAAVFQLKIADWKWTITPLEGDELEPRIHFAWCLAEGGKRVLVAGGSTDRRLSTSVQEIDLDKVEPAANAAAKKK